MSNVLCTQNTMTSERVGQCQSEIIILLAEDNAVNQKVALHQLRGMGYKAHAVGNGLEVLDALSKAHYDLVLMDCQMPGMDGYQATGEIRRRCDKVRDIPIVAMTANALVGDREKCIAAGMDDYIAKPVRQEQLAEILRKYLMLSERRVESSPHDELETCIDLSVLQGYDNSDMEDEPDLITELIDLYLADAVEQFMLMRDAMQSNAPAEFKRAAHSLKGSSANLGVLKLAEICQELERFGDADSLHNVGDLFPRCEFEFCRVQKILESEKSRRA